MSGFLSKALTFHLQDINKLWDPMTRIDLNNFVPSPSSPNGGYIADPWNKSSSAVVPWRCNIAFWQKNTGHFRAGLKVNHVITGFN